MFKIHLNISYQPASSLSNDQLPAGPVEILPSAVDHQKINALQEIVSQFNKAGDDLLTVVFSSLHNEREFDFDLIYTFGISAPYDTWTASIKNKPVLYFNLSD